MKRALIRHGIDSRMWVIWLMAAALSSIGCDNSVDVTAPEFPTLTPQWQTFQIIGTLSAVQGSCLEATILYDGIELPGARTVCAQVGGCAQLELRAGHIVATPGRHTIAFQVLSQSPLLVEYLAAGEVVAELGPADPVPFGPVRTTLEAGQRVTFEFDHLP